MGQRIYPRCVHFLLLTFTLFVFWIVLSGRLEWRYIIIGLVSSVGISIITQPLLLLARETPDASPQPAWYLPWLRLAAYFPWLMGQLVQANLQVAWLVIQPRLPIEPQIIYFRQPLPSPVAHVVLANSITLTPGTVTVDLEGDLYTVHALSTAAATSLAPAEGEGEMPRRVGRVFGQGERVGGT